MKICVIGAGYVGLTTAAVLSKLNHEVHCLDKDQKKITGLNQGEIPVYEPGLNEMIRENRKSGHLRFTTSYVEALENCEVILIAVGTPPGVDGSPDLSAIDEVTDSLARSIDSYTLILTKSTVPPGTNERIETNLLDKGVHAGLFDIAANPEFLREGTAIEDTLHPNKIVIGTKNKKVIDTVRLLYKGIHAPYIITTHEGAEMIKYASNAFLATKISFVNELSRICDAYGVDIADVEKGLGTDPRIGPHFLKAGLGYGGSCLPKDLDALEHSALKKQVVPKLLYTVKAINDSQINLYVNKLKQKLSGLSGKQITVWGLTFKANTDDTRFSPALRLIEQLKEENCRVWTYDPLAPEIETEIIRCKDLYESLNGSDALVIATDWSEFQQVDWKKVRNRLKGNIVLDGRNCLEGETIRSHGLHYMGVARR
ncbi:MAG TPA: UDP-glucose/GDP-mannose dehydrogenase family protein [Bacillales bacterium]